jgi:tetratricopeptide (TPR) repeat protein
MHANPHRMTKYIVTFLACCFAVAASAQHMDSAAIAHHKFIQRADSLIANYQFEKALTVLAGCDSLNTNVLLRIGQCQFRLGAAQAAIRPFEKVIKIDSTNVTALNQLGQLYTRSGDLEKALTLYLRLIALDSMNSYYHKQAGSTVQKMDTENILRAGAFYSKALSLNPADAETAVALCTILLDLGDFATLDSLLEKSISFDPHHKPLLFLKASSCFKQGRFEEAVGTLNGFVSKGDTTAGQARLLGSSYLRLKHYRSVIPCMNFLLKKNQDDDYIYYYLGIAYRELGSLSKSLENFDLAVKKSISENTGVYYSQLARTYEEMGNYPQAIKAYHAAYNYSKEGILLYHLARNYDVYYKDKETARLYYSRYLSSDDTVKVAQEYSRYRVEALGH